MTPDLFFITRISSILYDEKVLNALTMVELRDAISDGQLMSKKWLIDELKTVIADFENEDYRQPRIVIMGGWIGTLAYMIECNIPDSDITSVDIDARANMIAEKMNYDCNFKAITADMYDFDYSPYDIIINTSSEHIPSIKEWKEQLPPDKIIVVQNNNMLNAAGHISCVNSSGELVDQLGVKENYWDSIIFEGTHFFKTFNRYMVIART